MIAQNLSVLALRPLVEGASQAVGLGAGYAVEKVAGFLHRHFVDQSERLPEALVRANQQAWKALELALAGDSVWDRAKRLLIRAEQQGFREQLEQLFKHTYFVRFADQLTFRPDCLRELQAAKQQQLLTHGHLDPSQLAEAVGQFAAHRDPLTILDHELVLLEEVASHLRQHGFSRLATLVALRPEQGHQPLLIIAVRYFFRRAVEEDARLFQGLTFAQLEQLQGDQEQLFAQLHQLLTQAGGQLDTLLQTLEDTHTAVLDLQVEQQRQGEQNQAIYAAVLRLQERLDLGQAALRPRDSLSIRNDQERFLVRELVMRYRQLPPDERDQLPALLNAIGKLEVANGDFAAAQADFGRVAELVPTPQLESEAHYNVYRACLEQRDWAGALTALQLALAKDPQRFTPFPLDKYAPIRILGVGGFGIAFLCRHQYLDVEVVVKVLSDDELARDIRQIFAEGQTLRQLDHPAIIRLQDGGFADTVGRTRPYLVMDYFPGQTLEEHVLTEGVLSIDAFLSIAHPIVQGLQAAHDRGILHRDVKPGNLLIRHNPQGWEVKLIDFGLALHSPTGLAPGLGSNSLAGQSFVGTLDYAAPEQMRRRAEVPVGPTADIYGFGRTACFALFGTPQPLLRHWRMLPTALAELLEACLEEDPAQRPKSMAAVEAVLQQLAQRSPPATPVTTTPTTEPSPAAPAATELLGTEQRRRELELVRQEVADCPRCPELVRSRIQPVFGAGEVDVAVMFIGEAPAREEDRNGMPFVGASGQLLDRMIAACGWTREEVYLTNLIKCRPPNNRSPVPLECTNCQSYLDHQIELVQPRLLCTLGATAAQALLHRADSLTRLRGRRFDYRGVPLVCTYHPAYLLPGRAPEKKREVWRDLQFLLEQLGRPTPQHTNRFTAPF